MTGLTDKAACPYSHTHGNPFRYCECGWMETPSMTTEDAQAAEKVALTEAVERERAAWVAKIEAVLPHESLDDISLERAWYIFADIRALLSADDVEALEALDAAKAKAWDEGFMNAASQDHPAYPRTRRIDNPYEVRP